MKVAVSAVCWITALCTLFVLAAPVAAFAAQDVFTVRVGGVGISMLSEAQRDGDAGILIDASEADLKKFVPTGKFPNAVAVYLVRTSEGPVLIDTGYGTNVAANLKTLGLSPRDIRKVLITHRHGDHIGGLLKDGKAAFPNARVYVPKLEYDGSGPVREALEPYKGRVELIEPGTFDAPGKAVAPGIRPIAAYGHTPGHTMFMVESRGEKLLIWADLTHAMAIQMPRPDISVSYDSNPGQAAASRISVLKYVTTNGIPVAGMHIAYPGIGRVSDDPENPGGYKFEPWK